MKKLILLFIMGMVCLTAYAQKQVYIPQEHQAGINDCSSQYCMGRSYETDNLFFLWSSSTTPNYGAMDACETIYEFFYDDLKFASTDPSANVNNYKFVIMIDPATGGAFGSGVDGVIGAMWVTPTHLANFVFAHELGHSFSYQAGVDGPGQYGFQDQPGPDGSRIYCGPFWETTANYMAFQVPGISSNPTGALGLYMRTYNYFLTHARSRYEAWPILEAFQAELGPGFLGETWLQSQDPEHQIETMTRLFANNDTEQFSDLFAKCAMRLINWDIRPEIGNAMRNHVAANHNEFLPIHFQTFLRPIDVSKGRYAVPDNFAPQEYGYNAIKLFPERDNNGNATVYVHFRGLGINNNAGWRYGFVTEDNSGNVRYSQIYSSDQQIISTEIFSDDVELYLVVVGAPTEHTNYGWEAGFPKVYRYPYELALKNAVPEGYENDFRMPSGVSGSNHFNGGGFVANSANVSSGAYVGPNAKVLGNATVSGNARIEDWAVVTDNATVSENAIVRGHAIVGGTVSVYDDAVVADEARVSGSANIYNSAQVLDGATIVSGTINGSAIVKGNAFEWGQTIGGTAVMGGDNQNTSATSGVYLQKPDSNNGREEGDGLGASHESNVDINTLSAPYASDEEMEIPDGTPGNNNIALGATASTSYVSSWETLDAVNDGSSPSNSNDKSSGAYGNWDNPNSTQWVQYDWSQQYEITSVEVYWFDDNGGVLTPTTAYLEYWDGSNWVNAGSVPKVKDAWNALNVSGVTTDRLRLSMLNSSQSTGILEWRVFGSAVSTSSNIALSATASTSYVSSWETLDAVNDDSSPSNSNDKSSGAYGNWDNPNLTQWVQYDWSQSYDITSVEVYWFDDNGGVLTPTTAYLEYWDGSSWVNAGDVPKVKDAWNTLNVSGVTTDRLRLSMLNTSQSTGILEWRVFGSSSSSRVINVALPQNDQKGVLIFPNPVNSEFTIEVNGFADRENVSAKILDLSGSIISEFDLGTKRQLKLSKSQLTLNSSLYILKIEGGGKVITKKLMVTD